MNKRQMVMSIANCTAPLLGSRSKATKDAWAFIKKGSCSFNVAGVTFDGRQLLLARLEKYDTAMVAVDLYPEFGNPYDPHAVKVIASVRGKSSAQIGYVPRSLSASLAPLLKNACPVPAEFKGVHGGWGNGLTRGATVEVRLAPVQETVKGTVKSA